MAGTLNDASSTAIDTHAAALRPMLAVEHVSKRFGTLEVLRGISLSVTAGEVVVVIGPSGSGKTTLLRCINLLEDYEQGTVTVDGDPIGYRVDAKTGQRQRMSEREIAAYVASGEPLASGVIRGRKFLHPDMGIRFEVPLDYQLFDSPDAVYAIGPGQSEIIFNRAPAPVSTSIRLPLWA